MTSVEREFLSMTSSLIKQKLKAPTTSIENILENSCAHLCLSENAKRARPLLCLYYSLMFGTPNLNSLLNLGVAAEFIHAASLLHDDVIDEADRRRGKKSVNRLFGNAASVLAGNFLLTLGFGLLKSYDRKLIDKAIDVVEIMTRAAILEVKTRGRIDIGVSQWYEIANGKTGVLFGWCGFGVATLVDKPIDAQLLWQLGTNIGNIFQMADDLKDFNGDKSLKDQCRDIRNKEPSLPIIFAINSSKNIKVEFEKAFCKDEANMEIEKSLYLRELVLDSGAIDKTKEAMKKELDLLRVGLSKYEGTAGKDKIDNWITNLLNTQA